MAGIGFSLRALAGRDDYLGSLAAYGHAVAITSGPWIVTILALATVNHLTVSSVGDAALVTFRTILIYTFCFSLCLTAPVAMVATRTLSDMVFERSLDGAVDLLFGALALAFGVGLVVAVPFLVLVTDLPAGVALPALVVFLLLAGIWTVAVFLTALKDYTPVTIAFAGGMAVAVVAVKLLHGPFGVAGMLWGFAAGVATVLFALVGRVLAEHPFPVANPGRVLDDLRRYRDLALLGTLATLAAWVDKWIMWSAPEAGSRIAGMPIYNHYDGAMFFAYLTLVPALAMFTVTIETGFFERYRAFFDGIRHHAPLSRLREEHRHLVGVLAAGLRNLIILQAALAAVVIMLAPQLAEILGMHYSQLGMFRFGVLGALFHVLVIVAMVVLSYLDLRRDNIMLQATFLATNAAFTLASLGLGFRFYGYGYFLAAFTTACLGFVLVKHRLDRLPYVAFVRNNAALR